MAGFSFRWQPSYLRRYARSWSENQLYNLVSLEFTTLAHFFRYRLTLRIRHQIKANKNGKNQLSQLNEIIEKPTSKLFFINAYVHKNESKIINWAMISLVLVFKSNKGNDSINTCAKQTTRDINTFVSISINNGVLNIYTSVYSEYRLTSSKGREQKPANNSIPWSI